LNAPPVPGDGPGDLALGILTVDTSLIVRTWSPWLEAVTGIAAASAVGRPLAEVVPDLESRGLLSHFVRVAATGEAHVLAPAFHHYLIPCPPSRPARHFDRMQQLVTLAALVDEGRIAGVMATIEDVTARLDAEHTLAEELRSGDPAVRARAGARLQQAAALQHPGAFVDLLKTGDWQTRRATVEGLSRHASRDLLTSLIAALKDQHQDFNVLGSALQLLARLDIEVAAPLADLLRDPDPDLRIQVAHALGDQPGPIAGRALMAALDDEHPNVRFHAIESLGRLRWREAVERLAGIAESGDFFLAFPAVDALARIDDPRVAARLSALLDDDVLAAPAAEALGRLAGAEVVRSLTRALDRPNPPVDAIASAIATLHARYERLYGGGEYVAMECQAAITAGGARRLVEAIGSAPADALRAIVLLLAWVPDAGAEEALAGLLADDRVRDEALDTLVRRGGPRVVSALVERVTGEDLDVQLAAIEGLGRLGDRTAAPALARLLGRDRALSVAAAGALAQIGDASVMDPLFALLTDSDAAVRQAAIGALNSLGHPGMEAKVEALLRAGDPRGRESAVRIAGYFGYPRCIDAVVAACQDPDEGVRRAAVEQVPHLLDDRALPLLADALAGAAPRVRAAAASALGHVSGAVTLLVAALDDADPWVRYFAARSLGRQLHEGAPALEALAGLAARDAAPHVRIAAIEAIGEIGGAEGAALIAPHVGSDDPALASAALKALGRVRDAAALAPLLGAIKSADQTARLAAAEALALRADADAVAALLWTAGAHVGEPVGNSALDGLGRIAQAGTMAWEAAVDALLDLCASPGHRDAAVAALGAVRPEGVTHVAAGLDHASGAVRTATVDALMRMKAPDASVKIRAALGHEDPRVREAAVVALDRVGTPGLSAVFARMSRDDPSGDVRRAAAAAAARQGGG
jgi:HEAT repeat protein